MDYHLILEEQIEKLRALQDNLDPRVPTDHLRLIKSAKVIRELVETAKNMPYQSN